MNSECADRIDSLGYRSGAQQYQVTADVQTTSGEYYVTFTLESGTGRFTDYRPLLR